MDTYALSPSLVVFFAPLELLQIERCLSNLASFRTLLCGNIDEEAGPEGLPCHHLERAARPPPVDLVLRVVCVSVEQGIGEAERVAEGRLRAARWRAAAGADQLVLASAFLSAHTC